MKIVISKDIVKIENNHSENHYGEYNVNECTFQFDDYFNNVSVKRAIFTSRIDNKSIEVDIINNKCMVPSEILKNVYDEVTLGVYGYELSGEELLVRYSPTPDKFVVHDGSYKENAEHPEIITPTQYDIYSQALQEGLSKVDDKLVDVEKQGDYANTQGDYAKEQGDYAKEQGTNAKNVADDTQKKAEEGKFNGKSLEFIWQGTKLGVRLEGQEEYQFVDLQGVQGEIGATGEPFKIKKTYASVSEMNADFRNMVFGDYVMIASSVDVEDNAKLYTKGESAWIFISDFSGAMGIRGETGLTPNIKIGEVKTLEAGSQAKVTRSGSNEEPVFNFELPKGDKGDDYVLTEEDKVEIGEKVNTEYEKRIAENEKDIIDIESYLDNLTPKQTAKGELVHITDVLGLPVFETKTSGNVEQETTKGQQLFDYEDTFRVSDGVTVDKDGWITITYDNTNGTNTVYPAYNTNKLNLKTSTVYAIFAEIKKVSGTGTFIPVSKTYDTPQTGGQFNLETPFKFTNLSNNTIKRVTPTTIDDFSTTYGSLRSMCSFSPGESGSITFRLSVLEDTTVTPETFVYEPYTGGQASPNPEFPQEIEVLEAYNLLKITTFTDGSKTKTINGVTATINDNGTVTCKGTATDNANFYLTKNNLDFTLGNGYFLCNSPSANQRLEFACVIDGTNKYLNSYGAGNFIDAKTSFTFNFVYIYIASGEEVDVTFVPMFAKGTIQKPYLPYGCISYKVNGKNLLPFEDKSFTFKGVTFTCKNGELILNGTSTGEIYSTDIIYKNNFIFTLPAGNYRVQMNDKSLNNVNLPMSLKKVSDDTTIASLNGNNGKKYTITLTEETELYLGFYIYQKTFNDTNLYLMLEDGESYSDYEPYQEQIVTLDLKGNWVGKINDSIKDYLVTDKKKYWLVKNVGKVVLNGSENWQDWNAGIGYFGALLDDLIQYNNSNGTDSRGIANYFRVTANSPVLLKTQGLGLRQVGDAIKRIYCVIDNTIINSLADFKSWLSTHNTILYYQLATPEIIELGELPEPIKTFEGTNNIQVLANLDTEIEVKYALDLKKYYDNKLAEISAQII